MQTQFSTTKLKKVEGSIERYGRALYPHPYLGRLVWLEPIMGGNLHWSMVDRLLQQELTPDIDAVVDIGCGSGVMLVQLAVTSGRRDVAYFGADIARNGRAALTGLARAAGLENVHAVPFDLFNPEFSFLKPFRRVLVIIHMALVNGTGGCAALWEKLFEAVPAVRACLFETVSFAIPGLTEPPLFTREQSDRSGFDPQVFPVLLDLANQGRIRIEEVIPDFGGMSILGPVSLIRFETVRDK